MLYHSMVMLNKQGVEMKDVPAVLRKRRHERRGGEGIASAQGAHRPEEIGAHAPRSSLIPSVVAPRASHIAMLHPKA